MKTIGEYLHCFKCSESYQWMINDSCPKCHQDTDVNLHLYHEHMAEVEKQAIEHDYGEYYNCLKESAQDDKCASNIFDGTPDWLRMEE